MRRHFPLIAILGLALHTAAYADTSLVGANRVTGGFLLQSTPYKAGDQKMTVEGQIVEIGYKYGYNPKLAFGGGLALMVDGNLAGSGLNNPNGGSGIRIFGDVQYEAHRFDRNKVLVTSTFSYDRFDFSEVGIEAAYTGAEVKFGGLILHYFSALAAYGGLEYVGYSSGQLDFDEVSTSTKRDNPINLRLGGVFRLNKKIALSADALLMGETTLLFAADYAF